jgi:cytochrome b6-f complex iron-sulfur subunit
MSLGRRGFLGLLGAGGAAAAASALPGCAPTNGPAPSVTVPSPDADGRVVFRLVDYPALDQPGGAVIANAAGMDPLLVVRTDDGTGPPTVAALSAICTHQGCPLGYQAPEVVCPCHQSRFALDGRVLHPPATAPLKVVQAVVDAGGNVILTLATFPPVVAGAVTLLFSAYPELLVPGGSAVGQPAGYKNDILVMALVGGGYAAVDAICQHLFCTVAWPAGGGDVVCPCHGSRFTTGGLLLRGPATVGLTPLAVTADALGVVVAIPPPPP